MPPPLRGMHRSLLLPAIVVLAVWLAAGCDAAPLCHWNGTEYQRIEVATGEVAAHQCHGDVAPGTAVGCVGFGSDCRLYDATDLACTVPGAQGVCAESMYTCVNQTQTRCYQTKYPSVEVCDGLDNDCNGVVDDNIPQISCTVPGKLGPCAIGVRKCVGGVFTCQQTVNPRSEICINGVDDDCDGVVDDGCNLRVLQFTMRTGVDRIGADLGCYSNSGGVGPCRDACMYDTRCVAYMYHQDNKCCYKDSVDPMENNSGSREFWRVW